MAGRSFKRSRTLLLVSSSLSVLAVCSVVSLRAQTLDQLTDANPAPPKPAAAGDTSLSGQTDNVDAGIRHNKYGPFDDPPGEPLTVGSTPGDAARPSDSGSGPSSPESTPAVADAPAAPELTPPSPVILAHPEVIDSAKFTANGQTQQLFGVVGLPGDETKGLRAYIVKAGDQLTCQAKTASESVCLLPDGEDVAMVALVNGVAQARLDAPDPYRAQESAAQAARRGIWANLPPPPVLISHPVITDTATFKADDKVYQLDGVNGVPGPIASSLQSYVASHGDNFTCQQQGLSAFYTCVLPDGTDLADVALVNGVAYIGSDATNDYRLQQHEAIVNKRGIWATMPPAQVASYETPPPVGELEANVPAEAAQPTDGLSYVGGQPTALIDGEIVFLSFAGAAGWGYYDHLHHWRGAPEGFAHHLNEFHPEGRGLHGYGAGGVRELHLRGEEFHPGVISSLGRPGSFERPSLGGRPEFLGRPEFGRPAFAGRPEMGRPGGFAARPEIRGPVFAGRPEFNHQNFVAPPSRFAAVQPSPYRFAGQPTPMIGRPSFMPQPSGFAAPPNRFAGQPTPMMGRPSFMPQPNGFAAPQGGMIGRPAVMGGGFNRPPMPVTRATPVAVARPAPAPVAVARHK